MWYYMIHAVIKGGSATGKQTRDRLNLTLS